MRVVTVYPVDDKCYHQHPETKKFLKQYLNSKVKILNSYEMSRGNILVDSINNVVLY